METANQTSAVELDACAWVIYKPHKSLNKTTTFQPIYYSSREKASDAIGILKIDYPELKIARCEFYYNSNDPKDVEEYANFIAMLN